MPDFVLRLERRQTATTCELDIRDTISRDFVNNLPKVPSEFWRGEAYHFGLTAVVGY